MYVILNVNISIVQDVYDEVKKTPQRETARALKQLAAGSSAAHSSPLNAQGSFMNPRFFGSGRMFEALAIAYPEELVLSSNDTLSMPRLPSQLGESAPKELKSSDLRAAAPPKRVSVCGPQHIYIYIYI